MDDLSRLIETSDPSTWIEALPAFQKTSIAALSAQGTSYDEIANIWVNAIFPTTALFSANNEIKNDAGYLQKLREEFRAFLCGSKKYEKDRKQLAVENKSLHVFVVSAMSVSIAPYVGSAAPVIAPIIALMLAALTKVSLNAWCETV